MKLKKKGGTYRERSSQNYAYSTIKEIKKLVYLFNSWVLIIYATSCVSLLSFAIRSYNYSKNAIDPWDACWKMQLDSQNAIVKLDVCSKMPLDIVIFTSNPLTMLYDKNKFRPTCRFSLSLPPLDSSLFPGLWSTQHLAQQPTHHPLTFWTCVWSEQGILSLSRKNGCRWRRTHHRWWF